MFSSLFEFPKLVFWNIESVPHFHLQKEKHIYLISTPVKLLIYINYKLFFHFSFFLNDLHVTLTKVCCLLKLLVTTFSYGMIYIYVYIYIYTNQKLYITKINYFIIQQENNHWVNDGICRRQFTKTDVKDCVPLWTITKIRGIVSWQKRSPSQVYFIYFVHRYRNAF